MDTNKYFGALLAFSLGGILAVTVAAHLNLVHGALHPVFAFGAGIVPMALWHYRLWKHEEVSQTQIDTIYFFGFLVTLVTLGCAATFALVPAEQGQQITIIGFQFALGLLATGYGLLARVLLINRRVSVSGPDDALDQYLQKIGRVLGRFEETVALFDRLRDDVISKASDGAAAISQAAIVRVESELRAPLEGLRTSLTGISGELETLQTSDALKKLNFQLAKTIKALEASAELLPPFTAEVASATKNLVKAAESHESFAVALTTSSASMSGFADEAVAFTERVRQINIDFGGISRSTHKLVADFDAINAGDVTSALATISTGFKSLSDTLGLTNKEFETLEKAVQASGHSMSIVTNGMQRVFGDETDIFAQRIRSLIVELGSFSACFKGVTGDLSILQVGLKQFASQADEFRKKDLLASVGAVISELSPLAVAAQISLTNVQSLTAAISSAQQKLTPLSEAATAEMSALTEDLRTAATTLGYAMEHLAKSVRSAAEELNGS